ncbi:MAG TPA: hypothetical protein DER02_10140 [Gammaproteobacteria bacterium]|nr:hypothetical protein [Gammaproteobacteria bacterium]
MQRRANRSQFDSDRQPPVNKSRVSDVTFSNDLLKSTSFQLVCSDHDDPTMTAGPLWSDQVEWINLSPGYLADEAARAATRCKASANAPYADLVRRV